MFMGLGAGCACDKQVITYTSYYEDHGLINCFIATKLNGQ